MPSFGDFSPLCTSTPSYPWCNLFYRQLQRTHSDLLTGASASHSTATLGINPKCGIAPTFFSSSTVDGPSPSLGNIANILATGISFLLTLAFIFLAHRRKAAVGRIEIRALLALYAISLPLQLVTTGAFLQQGSMGLVVVTAIHAGVVVALFWGLLANALIATQVVEDGTWSSLVPYYIVSFLVFGLTTYIALDVGFGFTSVIGAPADPPLHLRSIPLFVLLNIWPPLCAVAYLIIMSIIVLRVLNESRPMFFYALAGVLFVLSQLAWFLLGGVICRASSSVTLGNTKLGRVDGSFIATVLETAAIGVLFAAWRSITEGAPIFALVMILFY